MSVLEARAVQKIYKSGDIEYHALHGIDLKVGKGDFLALCGPSGSGKTTLLNLLGVLDEPTAGAVLVNGTAVSDLTDRHLAEIRRDNFGFIFQTFNLIPVLTALENVQLPMIKKGETESSSAAKAKESLERVGLGQFFQNYPGQLSGGQRQRVAIARALGTRPKVILADEPTANLDAATAQGILKVMKDLNEKDGNTFVFSTHDLEIMNMARRLVYLRDGRLLREEQR